MTLSRRGLLKSGGGILATFSLPGIVRAAPSEIIEMRGSARGERIWFAPLGLAVATGTTLRFVNRDPGNSHTATAYHPDLYGRARRIPQAATPWDSDFLLPDEQFEVTLTVPGVYDYYCIPHEMAGMAGRIVVGTPDESGWEDASTDTEDVTPDLLAAFPAVEDILARKLIEKEDAE